MVNTNVALNAASCVVWSCVLLTGSSQEKETNREDKKEKLWDQNIETRASGQTHATVPYDD